MYAASLSDSLTSYDFLHSHFNLLTKRHIFHLTGAPSFFFCPYCFLSFSLFAYVMHTTPRACNLVITALFLAPTELFVVMGVLLMCVDSTVLSDTPLGHHGLLNTFK